jgi:predicted transport protein
LEEIIQNKNAKANVVQPSNKNPVMAEAGKKAAQVKATAVYSIDEHFKGKTKAIQELMHSIGEFVVGLDTAIEEVPKKLYIAYKASQNIVCMEAKNKNIRLFVKLKPAEVIDAPNSFRDVSQIGHYGTGESEFTVSTIAEFEEIKKYIELAYNKVGG